MSTHEHRTAETHPYDCKECDRRFAEPFALYQHAKIKHGCNQKPPRIHDDDDHLSEADYQTWMRL